MSAKDKLLELDNKVKEEHKRTITALREAAIQKEIAEYKARCDDAMLRFRNSRMRRVEGAAEAVTDLEEARLSAKRAASAEAAAYNSEWKMCMLSIIANLSKFVEAGTNQMKESFTLPIQQFLSQQAFGAFARLKNSSPELELLPVLMQEVKLNQDDVLEVKLTSTDRNSVKSFNEYFREAIVLWLEEKGYRADPNPQHAGKFINQQGERLTKEQFEQLKPQFMAYLTENSSLTYEEHAQEEPEPASLRP